MVPAGGMPGAGGGSVGVLEVARQRLDRLGELGDRSSGRGVLDRERLARRPLRRIVQLGDQLAAVGGHGDVWHFDGRVWRQMGFPTNEQLATVTCAGDGNVYITSEGGSLWVGQLSTWRLLEKRGSSVLWNDVRWFDGKLWLASDYQLRVWNGREITTPALPGYGMG